MSDNEKKLKILNQLETWTSEDTGQLLVAYDGLRDVAREWIEKLEKDNEVLSWSIASTYIQKYFVIQWIKHFFNLEE